MLLISLEQQTENLKSAKKYLTEKSGNVCIEMKHSNAENI